MLLFSKWLDSETDDVVSWGFSFKSGLATTTLIAFANPFVHEKKDPSPLTFIFLWTPRIRDMGGILVIWAWRHIIQQ